MKTEVKAQIKKYVNDEIVPLVLKAVFLVVVGAGMSFAASGAAMLPSPYSLLPRRLISENYVPATLIISTAFSALCGGIAFFVAFKPAPVGRVRSVVFWTSAQVADFSFGVVSVCYGLVIAAFIKKYVWDVDSAGIPASLADVRLFIVLPIYAAYFSKAPSSSVGMGRFCALMGVFCVLLALLSYHSGSEGASEAAMKMANQ